MEKLEEYDINMPPNDQPPPGTKHFEDSPFSTHLWRAVVGMIGSHGRNFGNALKVTVSIVTKDEATKK